MVVTIYSHALSPPARMVVAACSEIGLEINVKDINFLLGDARTNEYLKINPRAKVPAMDDDGFLLWESRSIARYLVERYAPHSALYPADLQKRAVVNRWLDEDHLTFEAVVDFVRPQVVSKRPPDAKLEQIVSAIIDTLEEHLMHSFLLTGNNWTLADLSVASTLLQLDLVAFDFSPWPAVKDFLNRYKAKPYFTPLPCLIQKVPMGNGTKNESPLITA